MPSFSLNTGGATTQNSQNFNGFDSYAMGSRQATPSIATSLRGQSTVGARNILMVYSMGLRVGGGTYDPGTGASTRPFIGCWRIWNSTAPTSAGASASSLSASAQTTIAAVGNVSTTKVLTTMNMSNVILNGAVTYLFGFNNASTTTAIWAGVSRVPVTGQSVYQDTLTSTPNDDSFTLSTASGANPGVFASNFSMMGTINYYTIPPAPSITSISTLTNGAQIFFTVSETNSSTTTGCKAYYSLNNVSFTEVTGTFAGSAGSYSFTITSTSLTLGETYYFKVCALNAVTTLDNTNNPTYDTRSLDSNTVQQLYGNAHFFKVRNATNTGWSNANLFIRTGVPLSWSQITISRRSSSNTWINNTITAISATVTPVSDNAPLGYSFTVRADLTGATATAYAWSRTGGTYVGTVTFSPSASTQQVTVTGPSSGTQTTIIQCVVSYSGGSVSTSNYTISWGAV